MADPARGLLEYDVGQTHQAEATRTAALQLGRDAGNAPVTAWAHEMRAWFAITHGRFGEVVEAAHAGQDAAPGRAVCVQLHAQEAKAWARMGNRRNVDRALEKGRVMLDSLPYPERPDNHFVVDPDKFDFYAMDCYRLVGEDDLAEMHARETLRRVTGLGGRELSPMRHAEAEITLAVVAARRGDLDGAAQFGGDALTKSRRCGPSLRMVGAELDGVLHARYPDAPQTVEFHDALVEATRPA